MLKNIIAPVQAWLLSQNKCVGCGTPLAKGTKTKKGAIFVVTCKCKRVYIYNEGTKKYRRALLSEV